MGILHIGHFLAEVLLLGEATFALAQVLMVLLWLVLLRVLLVSVERSTIYVCQNDKVEQTQEEQDGKGRHGQSLWETNKQTNK